MLQDRGYSQHVKVNQSVIAREITKRKELHAHEKCLTQFPRIVRQHAAKDEIKLREYFLHFLFYQSKGCSLVKV